MAKSGQMLVLVVVCGALILALYGGSLWGDESKTTQEVTPTNSQTSSEMKVGDPDWLLSNGVESVEYLIIAPRAFAGSLQPLVEWKTQRGVVAVIETTEDIDAEYSGVDLSERIRNCIREYHESGTRWVLLAGGDELVPSRSTRTTGAIVKSDYYYADLDGGWSLASDGVASVSGGDWIAEVYVGRLPADDAAQAESLVSRIIEYERSPPVGAWMTRAVFAGTFCTFNRDANGNNVLDAGDVEGFDTNRNHNWLKENMLPAGWTSVLLAEREGVVPSKYPSDAALNEQSLTDAVNEGACIIMADAHGSEDGMFRSIFTVDKDGDQCFDSGVDDNNSIHFIETGTSFDTAGKDGFYFLAACMTGTFTMGDCLTEHLVRTAAIGAIGSYESANYDSRWYNGEHLGWYAQGLSTRLWEQLLQEDHNQPGLAFSLAKADYVRDYKELNGGTIRVDDAKTLAQFNLMGDPEVQIWTSQPPQIAVDSVEDLQTGALRVTVTVDGEPLTGATVTLTSPTHYSRATTDESGNATLPLPAGSDRVTLTVSKNHYLPYHKTLD
jgi:hypothetical protein